MKTLDRQKKREYNKKGNSAKWRELQKVFEAKYKKAAREFLEKNIKSLKEADPSKYYSTLKRMGAQPGDCSDVGSFTLLNHMESNLTSEECTENIAQHFAKISQEFLPLDVSTLPNDVKDKLIAPINPSDIPKITTFDVYEKIKRSKKTKSQVPGDLPKSMVQEFYPELASPLASIYQSIVKKCQWPSLWKTEYGIPLQKVKNPKSEDDLRIISLTSFFNKVFEQFVMDWLMKFIGEKIDWCQFGGLKGNSISHYLIHKFCSIQPGSEKPTSCSCTDGGLLKSIQSFESQHPNESSE